MARKKEAVDAASDQKVPKKYYDVANYLKSKLPEKTTSLLGHKVNYFIGRKAIDALMECKEKFEVESRSQACYLLEELLAYKFFHRALKIVMEVKSKKNKEEVEEDTEPNATPKATPRTEKGKKKFKLDMHQEQIFIDANEPYVWLYDPIPLKTWILGSLCVVAAIVICMFPLWPRTMRDGVYYLTVTAASFLGFILLLAVVRQVLFVIIFMASFGKHRLWILPNLTEDCGFFESFVPLYSYEYCGEGASVDGKKSKSSNKKSSKDSPKSSKATGSTSKDEKTGSEESEFEILDPAEEKKDQ